MKKFFQSQIYANFWKFSIIAPLMSGLLTATVTFLVFYFTAPVGFELNDLPLTACFFGGVATSITFIPALIGFWLVWFVAKKEIATFSTVSIMTALMLGLTVLFFFLSPTQLSKSHKDALMVLVDVSLLGSVIIFYKLSKKYIEPVLSKS